jgi:hypothetical protein
MNHPDDCQHMDQWIIAIIRQCRGCGTTFTIRPDENAHDTRFAELALHVRQGLIPVDVVLAQDWLTDAEKGYIEQIVACDHERPAREVTTCCGGDEGERCNDCGRVFRNKTHWILEHPAVTM